MRRIAILALPLALCLSLPATGQVSDTETFISAVRSRDGGKAMEILESRGPSVLNARNSKGETALLIAVSNRDTLWTRFLLQQGADPNVASRSGETPLIAAARVGFVEAVEALLAGGARVDETNRMGETPLIVAVQQRQVPTVRALLAKGADPDITDNAAGYSARDYAKRDTRSRELLQLIERAEAAKEQ